MQKRFRSFIIRLLSILLGLCVMTITGLAVLQVILRYVFASPLMWVEEISVMIMLWITWLGASLLWITRSHIVVDLLTSQFSKQVQRILVSLIDILTVIAAVTLLIVSIVTLRTFAGLELDSLAIDLSIKYYPVPIGAIGIGLAALLDLWRVCQSKETGS